MDAAATKFLLHARAIAGKTANRLEGLEGEARTFLMVGATREAPTDYFLEAISHHVYAGDTLLHVAAAAFDLEAASRLINAGANVSAKNRRGAEPLHYAADGAPGSAYWDADAQASLVKLLLESGADPNVADKSGTRPLHRAVRTRGTGAVRALLAGGADPMLTNGSGTTATDLAMRTTGKSGSGSDAAKAEQRAIIALFARR